MALLPHARMLPSARTANEEYSPVAIATASAIVATCVTRPFTLAKPDLDKTFLAEAQKAGLTNLEGHRSVGGMRASLYNAMPTEGVNALVEFMQEFARRNG